MSERSSIASYLADFQRQGMACAYVQRRGYRTERWSYRQVADLAQAFTSELSRRGISPGDRVMLWGRNSAEWVAAFFGCALCGAVVVPMDDAASLDFAGRVLRQVEAKLLVCSRDHADIGSATFPRLILEDLPHILPGTPCEFVPKASMGRDEILQIVFTSGTTADPKGVVITHGNVLANVAPLEQQIRGYLRYERFVHPIRFLNLLPLSHVFGQFLGIFLPPILGGTVIFQDDFKPSEVIATIHNQRVSVLVSVPRVLDSLKQKIERDLQSEGMLEDFRTRFQAADGKHFLRRWWTFRDIRRQFGWKFWAFISGGAALDRDTEEFWGRLGYAAIQGYGLTETTSLISVNHPFHLGKGSIGKVLAGRDVKLAPDGEILVRGAGVASGYWDANGRHQTTDAEGWYRTGDIGALDEEGNLYFKGRKKEVIVTPSGTNIYPDDLEAALRAQPDVKDCIVVGIDRGENAEPCAVLLMRDGANTKEALERANQSLSEYQRMHLCVQWPDEDFPRTNTQKPRRKMIEEFARAQLINSGIKRTADSGSLAKLIQDVAGRSAPITPDASLEADLGLRSLDRVELLSAVEDRYQVDLSETRFSAARTVGDLERMLRGENAQRTFYHYPAWTLRWPATWLRFLAHYLLMRPAILLLGWPRIEGRDNLQGWAGPLLVVSNHIGHVDVGFILTALPARLRHRLATAAGGEALEILRKPPSGRGFVGRLYDRIQWTLGVALLNLFPLPREAGFRQSFAYAGRAVDRGFSVLVFPEGRHTQDGNICNFRTGIGLLANNLSIPVLPMRIVGLFEVKHAGRHFARPYEITVRIGKPIRFEPTTAPEEVAARLQEAVESL